MNLKATKLPIHEHFYAFQGEGVHTGRAAYFIRLFGCDQKCHFCDAAGTWHPRFKPLGVPLLSPLEVCNLVKAPQGAFVVLTGGEPTLYDLDELITRLQSRYNVHIETAGHRSIPRGADWVTLSPKPFAQGPLRESVARASEFKIIVEGRESLREGLKAIESRALGVPVWLHPEWGQHNNPDVLNLISEAVKADPSLRAGWQMHKCYHVDSLDRHSREAVPLGGDEKRGASI
jgi:7-carboxy-7-deazaguanine synthase